MRRFEYKEVEGPISIDELNEFGNEGWELITYNKIALSIEFIDSRYIFKIEIVNS